MSKCSKELDPLFEEISAHALTEKGLEKDGPDWQREEAYLKSAYAEATKIFRWYNPDFRPSGEPDKSQFLKSNGTARKRDKA